MESRCPAMESRCPAMESRRPAMESRRPAVKAQSGPQSVAMQARGVPLPRSQGPVRPSVRAHAGAGRPVAPQSRPSRTQSGPMQARGVPLPHSQGPVGLSQGPCRRGGSRCPAVEAQSGLRRGQGRRGQGRHLRGAGGAGLLVAGSRDWQSLPAHTKVCSRTSVVRGASPEDEQQRRV